MPTETRSPERSFEEYLNLEQAEVARSGRLGAMHWLIVGTSFLITLLAWYGSQYIVTERASQRFEREADQIVERVTERLQRYEDALWAAAAAVEANDGVGTLQGWRNYTRRLDLAGRYPNVQALNVLYKVEPEELAEFVATQRLQRPDFSIRSQNKGDLHLIVTYASPELGNEKAIGFDTAHDPGRRDTLMRAAKLNEAQLTQPLVLVQDETQTTSILMAVPFYGGGQDPVPLNRSRRLEGLIAMPLMMNRVVNGVLGDDSQAHSLRITDGDAVIQDIDNTDMEQRQDRSAAISGAWDQSPEVTGESGLDERGQFRLERVVDVYGRQWKFDIRCADGG